MERWCFSWSRNFKRSLGRHLYWDFVNNKAEGFGRQDSYVNGEYVGSFGGELKNDYLNGKGYREYDGCKEEGVFKDHDLNGEGRFCEKWIRFRRVFLKMVI